MNRKKFDKLSDYAIISGDYRIYIGKMLYFVGAGMIANIECNKVINIFDSQGIKIPFNCNDNTFYTN